MLSQTSEYALRAILHLHDEGEGKPIRVDDIAEALDVPRNYLSKILHVLAREGFLESQRGPHGGFKLAFSAEDLPLAKVVGCFEPDLLSAEERCLLGRQRCTDTDPCAAHDRWKAVAEQLRRFFTHTTVADLGRSAGEVTGKLEEMAEGTG